MKSRDVLPFSDLSNEKPNKTAKGEYISLSLMSTSGHSDLAPLGMSMFTHLNDGCIDLILVKSTNRHEFVRYLRRHGNKKNQVRPFGILLYVAQTSAG